MTVPLVVAYDPSWLVHFEGLRTRLAPCRRVGALDIEHVGSTSVPGMAAKPIIDLDIVTRPGVFGEIREVLDGLGYQHEGDQGVEAREVFKISDPRLATQLPKHHLYVCEEGCAPLRSHRMFRDFLRARPDAVERLSAAKIEAAERADHDRKLYMELKAPEYARVVAEALLLLDDELILP